MNGARPLDANQVRGVDGILIAEVVRLEKMAATEVRLILRDVENLSSRVRDGSAGPHLALNRITDLGQLAVTLAALAAARTAHKTFMDACEC